MLNLEAYEVVGCEDERAESDSKGRRVSSVFFLHLWSVGVFSFQERGIWRKLHSCFRSHFCGETCIHVSAAVCGCFLERESKDRDCLCEFQ